MTKMKPGPPLYRPVAISLARRRHLHTFPLETSDILQDIIIQHFLFQEKVYVLEKDRTVWQVWGLGWLVPSWSEGSRSPPAFEG